MDAQSDFWVRKMKTHFARVDINGDGVVTAGDFEQMADRFIDAGGLDDEAAGSLRGELNTIWTKYWNAADANQDGQVTPEEFVAAMSHVVSDPELSAHVGGPLPGFFRAIDSDGDGVISATEYETFFKCIGIAPELAAESFAAIDTDSDGALSSAEFVAAGEEFFLSDDEGAATRNYWGPLVD